MVSHVSNSHMVVLLNLINSSQEPCTLHKIDCLFLTIDPSKQSTGRALELAKEGPLLKLIFD
jgi:hypothetical protein